MFSILKGLLVGRASAESGICQVDSAGIPIGTCGGRSVDFDKIFAHGKPMALRREDIVADLSSNLDLLAYAKKSGNYTRLKTLNSRPFDGAQQYPDTSSVVRDASIVYIDSVDPVVLRSVGDEVAGRSDVGTVLITLAAIPGCPRGFFIDHDKDFYIYLVAPSLPVEIDALLQEEQGPSHSSVTTVYKFQSAFSKAFQRIAGNEHWLNETDVRNVWSPRKGY